MAYLIIPRRRLVWWRTREIAKNWISQKII